MKSKGTAIWVTVETKRRLEKLRSGERDTVGDVVKRILDERNRGTISDPKLRRELEKEE